MTKVFIVRPFGNRSVTKKDKGTDVITTVKYDFDKVETELIKPAMNTLNLDGGTTGEVFEAGDIREDMFSELLLADIVIADITIYNANVFYELGIRHALRDKRTILIKCPGFDETPFDIIGYRYISYEKENPKDALPDLIRAIDETIKADRKDSPVFNILPQLESQDTEKYLALPKDFIEDVKIAEGAKSAGRLALLAYEAHSFTWNTPAQRLIGEALFKMKAWESAKAAWEEIRNLKATDIEANDRLATIYQRLAESEMQTNPEEANVLFVKSNLAIETLISNNNLSGEKRAEAYALKARNAKTQWMNMWIGLNGEERKIKAQQSLYLDNAMKNYEKGFYEDLNHFYSGINALGLAITKISLAESNPEIWELNFDTKEIADQKLAELKNRNLRLATTVQVSIESAKSKVEALGKPDIWLNITEADLMCLTSASPPRVNAIYKKVIEGVDGLNLDATVRQLKLYESLNIKTENVKAALSALPPESNQSKKITHFILFTGHMIDDPGRKEPRFPATKEMVVRQWIKDILVTEKNKIDDSFSLQGIAGGACGGDILFLEICEELGIPAQMYLALPRDQFLVESVAFAGNNWVERFDSLFRKLPHPVLSESKDLPKWLQKKKDYNIWTRNNLWLLNSALVNGGLNMTIIALWDGKGGDGPGGTADLVKEAKQRGAKVITIDMNNA